MEKSRRRIGRKVMELLLFAVCCAALLTGAVSAWGLYAVKNLSTETSKDLGDKASADAETALSKQAKEQLQILTQEKAAYMNEKFAEVKSYAHGIAALAEDIYTYPEKYPDRAVALPVKGSKMLAAQLLWSKRLTAPNEAQLYEVRKLGNIQDLLVQYKANNEMVSSTYIATESGWMIQADEIAFSKFIGDADIADFYEADTRLWYQEAIKEKQTIYSDIIQDVNDGRDCIVCAQPVFVEGEIVAVAGVGSYLETVNAEVMSTKIGETGYAFLVNQNGHVIASSDKGGEVSVQEGKSVDLLKDGSEDLRLVVKKMIDGKTGIEEEMKLNDVDVYLSYAPLSELGWSFAAVIPVAEVMKPVNESGEKIMTLADEMTVKQDMAIRHMFIILAIMLPLVIVVVGILGAILGRKITEPLKKLTEDVANLNGGNLDYQIEVATGDEVEDLGNAFNQMTAQLKEYIRDLASVTAEKERIRTELQVASRLQADMLPDPEHAFDGQKEFTLQAFMTPAKEVGGDFYDFFLLDQDHLALVVADVSGKGVPAALFMVVSRTMLRSSMASGIPLSRTAEEVNNALLLNNENGMFVTTWVGVLTLSTGMLRFVNAGHCHPLLTRKGKYVYLMELGGMMLSGLEDSKYQESAVQLEAGDMLFQYSDGVVEAHDENNELYGEDRLEKLLNEHTLYDNPKHLIETVWKELESFRGSREQFDDITMLALCYHGRNTGGEDDQLNRKK